MDVTGVRLDAFSCLAEAGLGLLVPSRLNVEGELGRGAHLFVAYFDILIELRIKYRHSLGCWRELTQRRLEQGSCRREHPQRRRRQHLAIGFRRPRPATGNIKLTQRCLHRRSSKHHSRTREVIHVPQSHYRQRDSPRSRTIAPSFFGAWYTSFTACCTGGYNRLYALM